MALYMDRVVDATDISFYCNTVLERGFAVCVSTAGSGVNLDSPSNVCTTNAVTSGSIPLGILLSDVVSIDLTRLPLNWYKDQTNVGNKVPILTKGWIVTNKVLGTPTAGQLVQLGGSGNVTGVAVGTPSTAAQPLLGNSHFRSSVDEAGYAKIYIDM